MTSLAPFPVHSAGAALHVLHIARALELPASYHPSGGSTVQRYTPVLHTVWVEGTPEQLHDLRNRLIKESAHAAQ